MTKMNLPLVLSIRPHYADMVFVGTKKAELRRRMASVIENRPVFVYVTSPVREIRGGFRCRARCGKEHRSLYGNQFPI